MTVEIPFNLGEPVYVLEKHEVIDERKWIKPDYSLGGDGDGPFDRGHYEYTYKTITEIRKVKFHFGLLDKYKITEIYRTRERAEEARDGHCRTNRWGIRRNKKW